MRLILDFVVVLIFEITPYTVSGVSVTQSDKYSKRVTVIVRVTVCLAVCPSPRFVYENATAAAMTVSTECSPYAAAHPLRSSRVLPCMVRLRARRA